jgi:hypothetical protein
MQNDMQVTVIKMRRDGVVIRKSSLSEQTEYKGYLTINDTQQNHLHRMAKTARLFKDVECEQPIETLIEPALVWVNEERIMISGFEHVRRSEMEIDYAQSWLCLLGWEQSVKTESEDKGPISRKRR